MMTIGLPQRDQDEPPGSARRSGRPGWSSPRCATAEPAWRSRSRASRSTPTASSHSRYLAEPSANPPATASAPLDHAPDQHALEVGLPPTAAQRDHHEHAPADLLDRVAPPDPEAKVFERPRQRRRHGQADQHEQHEQQPDRHPLRVQPVGHPGGVRPDQPDHHQQQPGLQRAGHGGVAEQVVRQLGDRDTYTRSKNSSMFVTRCTPDRSRSNRDAAAAAASQPARLRRSLTADAHQA